MKATYHVTIETDAGPDSVADGITTRLEAAMIAAQWEAIGYVARVFDDAGVAWQWWKREWQEGQKGVADAVLH